MKLSYGAKKYVKVVIRFVIILVIGYFYVRYPFYKVFPNIPWASWVWIGGLLLFVNILGFVGAQGGKWRRGIQAELDVEDVSHELPGNFIVLSNIVPGRIGNIDQIIIGPTGIWVIEVKSHTGRITFDGKELRRDSELLEKDFLKQVWAETYAVHDILKRELNNNFFVQSVICFSDIDAEMRFGLKPVKGVYVIGLNWLNKLILKSPTRLDSSTVNEVVKILEKYKE